MGWFLSYQLQSWRQMWSGAGMTEWMKPDLYVDMARSLERAGFDFMMFEDGSFVPDMYGGSTEYYLRNAQLTPKHDPLTLVALLAQSTNNIGLIATVTTTFYPPFIAARMMTSLDHLTNGRVGANLVTSHNNRTAQNFGLPEQMAHDERYAMAEEWITLAGQLWESWDEDALVLDEEAGIYADHTKVNPIDFDGQYFRSRGPLNTIPGPQRRPVICQAGGSAAGKDFAAKNAEVILALAKNVDEMKAYREDITRLAIGHGRDPNDIKVMFIAGFTLADTERMAAEKVEAAANDAAANIEANLVAMSFVTGRDFSKYDLDAPLPSSSTNAAQASAALHLEGRGENPTLREIASKPVAGLSFSGTPDSVAAQMGEAIAESGADGFLVQGPVHRRYIAEVADGLGPALRRRGLIRDRYDSAHLRDNLRAF
ncbi:NtaA/DmoA family FMN-dependent monooxygenase [Herbiconiux sp. P15]|uniref:NtaA/DmoA family FMN-dependent monooxygenase n=1 Tax=Herbiconiux liukaitaii TaxID=3342799 RepID=UPI0035B7A9A2